MNSIVGLFTDVLPAGGVQRAGRHVAAVTAKFASDRGMAARFLSLNDSQGLHTVRVGALEFSASGYAGSKAQFVLAALRAAGRNPALVIALHPHLAPIVWAMSAGGRTFRLSARGLARFWRRPRPWWEMLAAAPGADPR